MLGVSAADVSKQVQSGGYPGRYLDRNLEMRIPAADVRRALEQRPLPARRAQADLQGLEEAVGAWLEEGRQQLIEALDARDDAIHGLSAQVRRLEDQVERLTQHVHRALESRSDDWSVPEEGQDLDDLMSEIRALESVVGLVGRDD